jgi:hypothetical protein
MRPTVPLLLAFVLGVSVSAGEVDVRPAPGGLIDLRVTAAPLADVLDRIARHTGMQVVYEGPPPRQLVSVALMHRTPAEAVLAVFEGLGLNYALRMDATGTRVDTLLLTGTSSPSTPRTPEPAGSPVRPMPEPQPQPEEPDPDPEPEEPQRRPGQLPPGQVVPGQPGAQPFPGQRIPQPGQPTGQPPDQKPEPQATPSPAFPAPFVYPTPIPPRPGSLTPPGMFPFPGAQPSPAPTPTPTPQIPQIP